MNDLDRLIDCLPQKPPFLFVDHLTALDHGVSAVGTVCFQSGHPIFENHLPGRPLVPGVILIEALAQLCGLALVPAAGQPVVGLLAEVGRMRFRRLIQPDETIVLQVSLTRQIGSAARFDVRAEVDGELAAEGQITVGGMR